MIRLVLCVVVTVHGDGLLEPFSKPGLPSNCVVVPPVPPDAATVRVTGAVWLMPPPLAVTVTLKVPVVAVLLAENVSVELPLPGATIEVGLKLAVTPVGSPETESDTAELKPPAVALETVVLALPPWLTERLPGEVLNTKSGVCVPGFKMISSTGCN